MSVVRSVRTTSRLIPVATPKALPASAQRSLGRNRRANQVLPRRMKFCTPNGQHKEAPAMHAEDVAQRHMDRNDIPDNSLKLHINSKLASPARFELTAPRLGILCSILLSYGDTVITIPQIPVRGKSGPAHPGGYPRPGPATRRAPLPPCEPRNCGRRAWKGRISDQLRTGRPSMGYCGSL